MTSAAARLPGTTAVGERAVRRIAERAAAEVAGVEPEVRVSAQVVGTGATLRVRLPVRYPLPVGRVTDECRAHLIARTEELTGLTVPRVDIEVSALVPEPSERRVR
ncbi:Asp23/Gls24 family envelope stress response protein [Nocardia mangyaensis]|uniref:Asp23/Gls24 family envelope stress response protein n=1 Tax=Nocardia mangyaensis TaxID=2213200 RepID=UPI0026770C62|nr:Asp23/Gls24 family envelope stress response protein [Nocardia mangyaensis]MDO3651194.1 Asp23/Gls24 family envelope stress response protein [Nocardia mangyaensis]